MRGTIRLITSAADRQISKSDWIKQWINSQKNVIMAQKVLGVNYMDNIMDIDLYKEFSFIEHNLKNRLIERDKGIAIFQGKIPVLLSAPHSSEQTREGKIKSSESRTASIVQYIHEKEACFGAFKTMNFNDDANYDKESYYKNELIKLIQDNKLKLLYDLHIMAPEREHCVDIGTGLGRNILFRNDLLEILRNNFNFYSVDRVKVDYMFDALYENTVSSTISKKCGIPCFQIEINWNLLDEKSPDNKLTPIIKVICKSMHEALEIL